MKYISTRGYNKPTSFINAIFQGLAPDGGLFVPQEWPQLSNEILKAAATCPYWQTAAHVLKAFAGDDLDLQTCEMLCQKAYGAQWASEDITPIIRLDDNLSLLELYYGPSLAFKDVAMQLIGVLFEHLLAQKQSSLSVVCATSGDTGGAAVEAFKNKENIECFILMPDGRVSETQKRFMTASGAQNIHAIILNDDFDKAQAILKGFFADKDFVDEVKLAPVNSVNFARIIAQCVYFVIAAAKLGANNPVNFIVPTGNFGDAFSGFVAKKLGANIGQMVIANNANNALTIALESGKFQLGEHSKATISPAMDIQLPSNFERILFEMHDGDYSQKSGFISMLYDELKAKKGFDIDDETLKTLQAQFIPTWADDETTKTNIKKSKDDYNFVICPHTAVGLAALAKCDNLVGENVILATAHPAKFPETIIELLDINPPLPDHAKDLFTRPEKFDKLNADENIIKSYIRDKSN